MKKYLPATIAAILTLSLLQASAQTDDTKYDLGRIAVKKDFTQAVTIKAADLEKIPFLTLSDAVANWLHGVYGTNVNYATVIDGLLNADINAYSIYDIEEITLVQNAMVHLNGISPSQMLLLVKTKRGGAGKSGVTVAGQTNLISLRNTNSSTLPDAKSTTSFYHQYYASVYSNTSATQTGFSADWQHYTLPQLRVGNTKYGAPVNLNRIKLNAYFDAKLDSNNSLSINAGFVPQKTTDDYTTATVASLTQSVSSSKENLLHADVKLHSKLSGLNNELSAGIQHYTFTSKYSGMTTAFLPVSPGFISSSTSIDTNEHATAFIVKDNISYPLKKGNWEIEPNLNFSYTHFKDDAGNSNAYTSSSSFYSTTATFTSTQNMASLTPSLSFAYSRAFLVQGGLQAFLNNTSILPNDPNKPAKVFPFASATVNLLHLNNSYAGDTELKIYGSIARSMSNMSVYTNGLTDNGTPGVPGYGVFAYGSNGSLAYSSTLYNPYKVYTQIQAGTTLSLLKDKLNISYNYSSSRNDIMFVLVNPTPSGMPSYVYYHPDNGVYLHRVSVDMSLINTHYFNWRSGINTSVIKTQLDVSNIPIYSTFYDYFINRIITGGFINRLSYKKAFAGIDMLYRINQRVYPLGSVTNSTRVNSFVLQNLYIGCNVAVKGTKGAEVFANTRNLMQNTASTITDNRKFYGLGFKLNL
ncbi:hypothetical protein HQ865_02030 [Mucilaginibacter mali]|uniref:TonB-dependent receptor n=1 Tax=Mucilaginibacter mali TaxID=2740462 RepID=A0A7D4PRX7_9SPHI|nr:hypothetical protein [Mucilaginibacter mali]QKJ28583.1 hypothetical protein HQ865_02030 [Mucilaginibacter mali]